jgi:hypothetical protein
MKFLHISNGLKMFPDLLVKRNAVFIWVSEYEFKLDS